MWLRLWFLTSVNHHYSEQLSLSVSAVMMPSGTLSSLFHCVLQWACELHSNTWTWELKGSWLRYTAAPLVVWTGLKSCWSLYHWLTADGGSLCKHSFITSVVSLLSVRVWLMRKVEVLRGSPVSWWSSEVEAAGVWRWDPKWHCCVALMTGLDWTTLEWTLIHVIFVIYAIYVCIYICVCVIYGT